jgi:broad specificity phosphatase PhoE
LFGDNKPPKSSFTTDEEVGEWKYGAYEGMLTKDIREKQPGWEIWKDGYATLTPVFFVELNVRCPDGDVPGESPQDMSDRVDRTIARIRKVHQEVYLPTNSHFNLN